MNIVSLLPWAAFAGISCAIWAVVSHMLASPQDERSLERLEAFQKKRREHVGPGVRGTAERMAQFVENAAPTLSKSVGPKGEREQNQLRLRLSNAGFNSPHAVSILLMIKLVCAVTVVVFGGAVGLVIWGFSQKAAVTVVTAAAIGIFLPQFVLGFLARARQRRIFRTLPDALDLMIICIETGQGLDAALRRLAKELAARAPDLCDEFNLYNFQVQMGRPRKDALHDLGIRTGVEDLNSLSAVLIQSERFGSSIAQTLRDLSDSMRVKRRQLAEERAQKTAVKLIFPLVLFIFPGIFVILVGPAAILMIRDMLSVH